MVAGLSVRVFRGLTAVVNTPARLVWALIGVLVVCGETYALLEGKGPVEGLWWALVTITTVGYGDYSPATTAGRGVGAVLMVSGFVLVLCASAMVTSRMIHNDDLLSDAEQKEEQAADRYSIAMLEALCARAGVVTPQMVDTRAEYEARAAAVRAEHAENVKVKAKAGQ
jgi:hypothetical protein